MIGDEVRRRREGLGLTGAQLAARAGMAPSAVSQIETGKRIPSSASVIKLAEALGVEVGDLYPKNLAPPLPLEDWAAAAGLAETGKIDEISSVAFSPVSLRRLGGLHERAERRELTREEFIREVEEEFKRQLIERLEKRDRTTR